MAKIDHILSALGLKANIPNEQSVAHVRWEAEVNYVRTLVHIQAKKDDPDALWEAQERLLEAYIDAGEAIDREGATDKFNAFQKFVDTVIPPERAPSELEMIRARLKAAVETGDLYKDAHGIYRAKATILHLLNSANIMHNGDQKAVADQLKLKFLLGEITLRIRGKSQPPPRGR